jgi:hypothetical protein
MSRAAIFLVLAVIPVTWGNQQRATGAGPLTVTKVPSGDTVVISGIGKVRLLGVRSADVGGCGSATAAARLLNPTPINRCPRRRSSAASVTSSENSRLAPSFRN